DPPHELFPVEARGNLPVARLVHAADDAAADDPGARGSVEVEGRERQVRRIGVRIALNGPLPLPLRDVERDRLDPTAELVWIPERCVPEGEHSTVDVVDVYPIGVLLEQE